MNGRAFCPPRRVHTTYDKEKGMARTEIKTTQDLEREIRELEERLNKFENDPFLQSLLGRLIVLEVFVEAVYHTLPPDRKREFLEVLYRVPTVVSRDSVVDKASGTTAGAVIDAFIGHLESFGVLKS